MCTEEAEDKGSFLERKEAESLSHAGNLLEAQKYFRVKGMESSLPMKHFICRLLEKVPVKKLGSFNCPPIEF